MSIPLIQQIRNDRMAAYKAKENIKKNVLGCLISDSCKVDKEPGDQVVLDTIKKFIESLEECKKATTDGEYEHYRACEEIAVLEAYRPARLSEEEIKEIILVIPFTDSQPNMKEAMQHFKTNYLNQYDATLVSKLVRGIL